MRTDTASSRLMTRRATLRMIGVAGAAAFVTSRDDWFGLSRFGRATGQTFDCVAKPALTEGPYFVDERLNRSDIRTDPITGAAKAGIPLALSFTLHRLDSGACTPLAGAYVDVWHCDAVGKYSDEAQNNTTGQKYLRGYQMTDEDGAASFTTIFPGWYSGRTIHIHFKIRLFDGTSASYEFTSQLFFTESAISAVLATSEYSDRGTPDTSNSRDGIYNQGGSELVLDLVEAGSGYTATFDIGLTGVPGTPTDPGDGDTTPAITGALAKHKKLVVTGTGFDTGAVILLDGSDLVSRNNAINPTTVLVSKRGAASVAKGQTVTLQVRNSDGTLSNEFAYTRPAA